MDAIKLQQTQVLAQKHVLLSSYCRPYSDGEGDRQHGRPEQRANWGKLEGKLMCMPAHESVDRVSKTLLSEILKKKETKQTAQEFKEADTTSWETKHPNEQHYFAVTRTQLEATSRF